MTPVRVWVLEDVAHPQCSRAGARAHRKKAAWHLSSTSHRSWPVC